MKIKKRLAKASDHITFESDNEDLQDEIDKFHEEKTKVKAGSYRRAKKADTQEVLNVEGDLSEDENDDGDESSDFDDNEEEDLGISSNKWGRKRREYYSTDYVDKDWGGMRDEEMEEAELEEQDALARQKELDKAAEMVDYFDDEEVAPKDSDKNIEVETQQEWSFKTVKKLNKATADMLEEYSQRKDLMTVIVEPLLEVVNVLPENAALRKQLQMVVDVYSKYLMDIVFLLREKCGSFEKKQITDEMLAIHPANEEYLRSKIMIKKVDAFLDKNSDVLNKLLTIVKEGGDLSNLNFGEVQKKKKKILPVEKSEEASDVEMEDDEEAAEGDGKRKALGTIAKNSQSTKNKKRKDKHAKVANRRKYKEIQKKVRSQIGTVRKETEKYTGEARGIRTSTIKSVKLIA